MPSRRSEIAMTMDEINAYLATQHRVILVSNGANGYPHPMPMNFVFVDGVYLMTTFRKSQKVMNLRRDPRAALLVESGLDYAALASVLAYADAEILDDTATTLEIMFAIRAKEPGVDSTRADQMREIAEESAPKRVGLRFEPQSFVSWDHRKLAGHY